MKTTLTAATVLVWLATALCSASALEGWATYVNDRFGFSVSYPADVFAMQPPPENNDGRTLISADSAKILVFAGYNVDKQTLQSKRASLTGGDYPRITYNATGRDWFVVSGHRTIGGVDSIFYEKYIVSTGSDTIDSLIVTYPAALKARYDPSVDRVAASFKGS
jgi:hypothetical protein